jgi:hypothetical protein
MKKLLFLLCFLPSLAFAIDKPIPCEGANCKLKFETRDGSNVKVSAGEVSGSAWVLGSSAVTTSAAVNEIKNGDGSATNGANTFTVKTGNQGAHAARLKIQNSTGGTSDVFETTVGSGVTTFRDGAGAAFGTVNNSTKAWVFNGKVKSKEVLEFGDTSQSTTFGLYFGVVNPAATTTCETQCANTDSINGMGASSGHCFVALHAAQTLSTCSDATNEVKYCACIGLN